MIVLHDLQQESLKYDEMLKNFDFFCQFWYGPFTYFQKYGFISVLFWKMLEHLTATRILPRVSTLLPARENDEYDFFQNIV